MKVDLLKDLYSHDDGMPASLRDLIRTQELNLSNAVTDLLNRIFISETDTWDSNELESYTQRLVAHSKSKGMVTAGTLEVNTYPFGIKTAEVFPNFIGICADDKRLAAVLKVVQGQCDKMRQSLPAYQEKTIVLLTDKWDGPIFKKRFELAFLDYALKYNILFVFLLVTDYGVTRVPFLAQNRYQLEKLSQRNYAIEQVDAGIEALKLLSKFSPCVYGCRSGTWTSQGRDEYRYLFDFKAGICEITDALGEVVRKRIPKYSAQRFALAVYQIFDQPQQVHVESTKVLDAGRCMAEVFGVQFEWPNLGVDSISDPQIKTVFKAFSRLIDSLEEI